MLNVSIFRRELKPQTSGLNAMSSKDRDETLHGNKVPHFCLLWGFFHQPPIHLLMILVSDMILDHRHQGSDMVGQLLCCWGIPNTKGQSHKGDRAPLTMSLKLCQVWIWPCIFRLISLFKTSKETSYKNRLCCSHLYLSWKCISPGMKSPCHPSLWWRSLRGKKGIQRKRGEFYKATYLGRDKLCFSRVQNIMRLTNCTMV